MEQRDRRDNTEDRFFVAPGYLGGLEMARVKVIGRNTPLESYFADNF
jgi:hypothetical protein